MWVRFKTYHPVQRKTCTFMTIKTENTTGSRETAKISSYYKLSSLTSKIKKMDVIFVTSRVGNTIFSNTICAVTVTVTYYYHSNYSNY